MSLMARTPSLLVKHVQGAFGLLLQESWINWIQLNVWKISKSLLGTVLRLYLAIEKVSTAFESTVSTAFVSNGPILVLIPSKLSTITSGENHG